MSKIQSIEYTYVSVWEKFTSTKLDFYAILQIRL